MAVVKEHFNKKLGPLGLLSTLQLATLPYKAIHGALKVDGDVSSTLLYSQYKQYAIRVTDFFENPVTFTVPLIELAEPSMEGDQGVFMSQDPEKVASLLPAYPSTPRLVWFPQTRFSFLEDPVSSYSNSLKDLY